MTTTEKSDFNSALQLLWNSGSLAVNNHAWFASMHNTHFGTSIHSGAGSGENFTSFHRFFILHWELLLRNTNINYDYLSLPYWDWRTDPSKTTGVAPNSTNDPDFWEFSFLQSASFTSWAVSRNLSSPASSLPTIANVATLNGITNFPPSPGTNFSQSLEAVHGTPHAWVNGTMSGATSPLDPVFFLHHAMVDKIWKDWDDQPAPILTNASYATMPPLVPVYRLADNWIDDLDAYTSADPRYIPFRYSSLAPMLTYDVWYAENGIVVLDGSNNTDFQVNGNGKIYRYTTNSTPVLGGSMYIGDLYRVGNTINADNQGGFVVPAGVSAHFRTGGDISLMPGSLFEADSTSEVTFKLISTPNGF